MDLIKDIHERMREHMPEYMPTADELLVIALGNEYIAEFIDRHKISMTDAKRYLSKLREYEIAKKNEEADGYEPSLILHKWRN